MKDEIDRRSVPPGWQGKPDEAPFAATFDGDETDASLLLLEQLGFVDAQDPRYLATLAQVEKDLRRGDYLYRYAIADDFGVPGDGLQHLHLLVHRCPGRRRPSATRRERSSRTCCPRPTRSASSRRISTPGTGELWGNFPQTYSMVGLINSAMRLSRSWEEAF